MSGTTAAGVRRRAASTDDDLEKSSYASSPSPDDDLENRANYSSIGEKSSVDEDYSL